jgi:hypothetical protein
MSMHCFLRPSKGETTFKAIKSKSNQEQVSNEDQSEISDEEVENFMKKLKKGTCYWTNQ